MIKYFKFMKLKTAMSFCKNLLREGKYETRIVPVTHIINVPPYEKETYYEVQVDEMTEPKITFINTDDTPEVRKQLNPGAEKLDKENEINR